LPTFAHLLARFPARELAIHRLHAREPEFRGLCNDYEEAVSALRYWETRKNVDEEKAGDFRRLAAEIEADIVAFLDRTCAGQPPHG
jgi:hypothetical protein